MALQSKLGVNKIGFKDIKLFKDQTLGIGSYGKVCRARCDNLDCAAKLLHETLFDFNAEQFVSRRKEHRLPSRRFETECEFLNLIKHPNIIQYLGMYQDPSSGLAVLLMELMDCSLTNYLETSQYVQSVGVPFHIQVSICHDITLALSFLHSNGILHRDLSGNNVLLSGQSHIRAKVTDFGMASLSDQLSPRHLTYTMCPGTDPYMPPEAVMDRPTYSNKIDCFSFGVIVVQILTRKFPKPSDRLKQVEMNSLQLPNVTAFVPISERERRQEHIREADPANPLLQVALDCLEDKEDNRPSSQSLCETVGNLRDICKYRESLAHTTSQNEPLQNSSTRDERMVQELEEQIRGQRQEIRNLHQTCQSQVEQFSQQIAQKNELIEQHEQEILQKDIFLQQRESEKNRLQRDLQLTRDQLQTISLNNQHLEGMMGTLKKQHAEEVQGLQNAAQDQVQSFTKEIKQRDQIIKDLKEDLDQKEIAAMQKEQTLIQRDQVIDAGQQRIQQLKQQLDQERNLRMTLERRLLKSEQQHQSSHNDPPLLQTQYPAPAMVGSTKIRVNHGQRTLSLKWGEGLSMPCSMERSCNAVVKSSMVYFVVASTSRVYNFSITDNTCFSLPDCPFCLSSLVIVDGVLTAVGGSQIGGDGTVKIFSNRLFTFTDVGAWIEQFPCMPTKRDSTASLHTKNVLIVAGGRNKGNGTLSIVEVLNTETLQWSSAPSLPIPLRNASISICGDNVYFLGGVNRDFFGTKAVFTCSVNSLMRLWEPKSVVARLKSSMSTSQMWNRIVDIPVTKSTCISFRGCLLAFGGEGLDYAPSKAVYMYNPSVESWKVISHMSVAKSSCIVAALPGNRLMVGGRTGAGRNNNVEIACVTY